MRGLISVVIPVYNAEQYLQQCVESVLGQSYKHIEVILVDDGSTDNSSAISDYYAELDSRVRVLHQLNKGASLARIIGARVAQGDYVTFVDSDDWQEPEVLAELVQPFFSPDGKRIDISAGGYVVDYANGDVRCPFDEYKPFIMDRESALVNMYSNRFFGWSLYQKIYRTKLFALSDIETGCPRNYADDTYINWHLFRMAQNVAYVPSYGYHYRVSETSMTHQEFSRDKLTYLDVRLSMLAEADADGMGNAVKLAIAKCLCVDAIKYLSEMAKSYESYSNDIQNYIDLVEKRLALVNYKMSTVEKNKWEVIHCQDDISYRKALATRYEKLQRELIEFSRIHKPLFVYGTGIIGKEIAEEMEKACLSIEAFVVSGNPERKAWMHISHIDVINLQELIKRGLPEQAGLILAMNKRYTLEVRENLLSLGVDFGAIMDAGRYSMKY